MTSQELSFQLYKWLSLQDVLPSSLRYKSNGNFQLDSKSTQGLLNGFLISKLLLVLARDHNAIVNQPLISSIKQSNTPAARLYNWNILSENFLKLNINITKEMQKEITSGNFPTLVRFLLDLHKRFNPKKVQKKQQDGNVQINLKRIQFLSSYNEAQSFLQMIIMIISQKLHLTPKQTLSTLSENAKYYAHMIVKGMKNGFEQILDMLDLFISEMPKIMYHCERSPQKNTEFFLDLIKPTLISRQADVVKKGALLFKVFIQESLKYNSKNLIYQILTKENVGFDFLYMAIKRHPDLAQQYTAFIYPLIKDAFKDFFQVHLKRTINNEQQYIKIILKVLEGLVSNPQSKLQLKESTLLQVWIKNSQDSFNIKKNKQQNPVNQQTKILYLQLLCNLWKQYSSEINEQEGEEILMKGIEQLKRNARKSIFTIKIPAILRLFDFLHFLADAKNKIAPILYKKLIFFFIENHQQEQIREILVSNFIVMLKKYPSIPIEFLVVPLLKQLISTEGTTYILNIFDFDFFVELCRHSRMDIENALSYLQYFSKLYTKQIMYSKLVMRIIEILTNRFCEQQTIVQFLKRNIGNMLNLYGIMVFNKKKNTKEVNIMNKQKKSLVIQLLKHYIGLEHRELGFYILGKICKIYIDWNQNKNYTDKGLKYLINLFGDAQDIIMQYKIKQNENLQSEIPSESPASLRNSYLQHNRNRSDSKNEAYTEEQYMKRKGIGYKKNRNEQLSEQSLGRPDPKVLKDIQKLKDKLKKQVNRKKEEQTNEIKKLTVIKNQNSLELFQRNLSLGYAKFLPLQQDKIIFDFDSVKPKQLKRFVQFYDLNELQQIDQSSTQTILKQYSKEIKSLFLKYALISSANEYRKEQANAMMSFTEIVRMIHEKSIDNVTKIVVSDMIASINQNKHKQKNLLSGIFQEQFLTFLIKLTDYLIQNQTNTVSLPFGLKLQVILKKLFKGQHFYENKFRIKEDPSIAKIRQEMNDNGPQNIQLPQGYKKMRQNVVLLNFKCDSRHSGVKQVYNEAYQISDWLIFKALGIHIMTPLVQVKQKYTLVQIPKPPKQKLNKQQTEPMIKYENQQIKQGQNILPISESTANIISQSQPKKSQKINKKSPTSKSKRTVSQRQILKTKVDPKVQQQQKKTHLKQIKYAEKLRQNLDKLRTQKTTKQTEQKKKEQQQKNKLKKKQQQRKKYLQFNKQKIKERKLKEESEKLTKQQQQKQKKDISKQEHRRKEQELLEKQKNAITQKRQKITEKKNEIQKNKEKKMQQLEKLAKEITSQTEDGTEKLKMIELKNNLQNGELKEIFTKYQKQLTDLLQSYWVWEKKRIQLSGVALMLKDFHIVPQYMYPKTVAQIYKNISKGQALDYNGFVQLLVKCSYKSSKLMQEYGGQAQGQQEPQIDPKVFNGLIQQLRLNEANYKEIIKNNKHHLQ